MKHLITLCMFICSTQGLKAQHCNHAEAKTALRTQIVSREDTAQSGTIKYYLKLKALDTLTVDSIRLKSAYFTSFSYNGNYPIILNMNDSVLIEITVNYNNNSLPYYYKSIDHYVYSHSNDIEASMHLSAANIYFTPYGTTEVWNMIDFYSLPRVWEIQKTTEPQRVYIAKDSLPVSDLEPLDSTHEAWQENFQQIHYPGLPFAIEMKAIHPDTLSLYIVNDTSTNNDSNFNVNTFTIGKKFKGRVRGRLMSNYINDNGADVVGGIPLSGIKVELKSDGLNTTLTTGYTDDNGFYDLSYSVVSFFDGQQIELFLQFDTDCKKFDFKVKKKGAGFDDNPYKTRWDLPKQGKNADIQVGTITLDNNTSYPFRITSWTFKAYRFFENTASSFMPDKNLDVKLFADNSEFRSLKKVITLEELDERHETVIWHEFGHYVMDQIQPNDLEHAGGDHTSISENNIHLAWSEGWATGFMNILDIYYRNLDDESGVYSFNEGIEGYLTERRSRARLTNFNVNANGIRSEYLIGCAINDLFDGSFYFNSSSEYNDVSDNSVFNNLGYDFGFFDNVQLSSEKIFKALNKTNFSIAQFYNSILGEVSDCETRKNIKIVFDQNRIALNTGNIQNAGNVFSTDEICVLTNFNDPAVSASTTFFSDRDILSNSINNFNVAVAQQIPSGAVLFNKQLSDNLRIENNATLSFNRNIKAGWAFQTNIGTTPPANSLLTAIICANNITIANNGSIIVGDASANTTAKVNFGNNTVLEINTNNPTEPATLTVNNNSTLTIEEGAILKYYPGAKIILNGANAVLEIRGQIQVMDGATFTIERIGTNPIGIIKFIRPGGVTNLIASPTGNGKVQLNGIGNNNTHVHVIGNTGLFIADDILEFSITNAKVLIGANSKIEPRVKDYLSMENVNIAQLTSGQKHRGIYVCGLTNFFKDMNITGGVQGFMNFHDGVRFNRLMLENVVIDNCDIGILSNAKGVTYNGGEIRGYSIAAWKSIATYSPSNFDRVSFKNTTNMGNTNIKGIDIFGNILAPVSLSYCNIKDNHIGIYGEDANIQLQKCNSIHISNGHGLLLYHWSMLNSGNNAYTAFKQNQIHISTYWHPTLLLQNGNNGFYGQNSLTNPKILYAVLQPNFQPDVNYTTNPRMYNFGTNFFETTSLINGPNSTYNLWLEERGTGMLGLNTTTSTFANTSTAWESSFNTECGFMPAQLVVKNPNHKPTDGIFDRQRYTLISNVNINCGTGGTIVPVVNYCSLLIDSLYYAQNPNYTEIITGLTNVVNCTNTNNTNLMHHFLYDVYGHLITAYSKGATEGKIEISNTNYSPLTNSILSTIDNLKLKANEGILPWSSHAFELNFSKAEIYRMAAHRNQAISTLNTALTTFNDSLQQNFLNKYICINNAEIAFLNGIVSIDSIYIAFPCFDNLSNNQTNGYTLGNNIQNNAKINNSISLYPNPTNSELNIKTNNEQTILKIMVYDIRGMLQKTIL